MIPMCKPYLGEAERRAVLEVLDSGMLAQGPKVRELESRFAGLVGARNAVAVSSGTAALHLALLAHGVGPGDEVITTPFTFIATVNAILFVGATPVFVDIEPDTFNIDAIEVARAITPRTKAILPVHLFGHPADMDALQAVADERNIALIQDAAQAVGASYRGRPVGSEGTACFSLYATKNLMSGEGGMVTTEDDLVAEHLRLLRNHGMPRRYHHDMLGFNLRMSDLHAAIGLAQLERFEVSQMRRQLVAKRYSNELSGVVVPSVRPDIKHAWHQYTVRVPSGGFGSAARDAMMEDLQANDIGCAVFYPIPAHKQRYIVERGLGGMALPVTDTAAAEVLSIPVHPQLRPGDVDRVIQEVNGACLAKAS